MNKLFKGPKVDLSLFLTSFGITLFLAVYMVLNPEESYNKLISIFNYMTQELGFTYLWFTFGALVLALYLGFGKYSTMKMGSQTDTPDFSTFSWIGMIFTASTGSSLLYWGMIEWVYYMQAPPFGAEVGSWQAAEYASAYGMYHWGFSGWALYAIIAIPIAYVYHVQKKSVLRISEATRGVLGDRVDGWLGRFIDLVFVFGLIGGVATSMGLGTPMLTAGISKLLNIPHTQQLEIIIITGWTLTIGFCLYFGLKKGIKLLSDLNIYLAFFVIGFILLAGPTIFIINQSTSAIGLLMQDYIRMSFWTDAVGGSNHPQDWTIFYWAWWVVYAPAMGLYLAKISKGRTIRQIVLGSVLWGTIGSWVFYAVLGNYAMDLHLTEKLNIMHIFSERGAEWAITEGIAAAPLGTLLLFSFVVLAFISMVTGQTTIAFTLASVTSKNLKDDEEPARWNSLFWALLLGGISVSLLLMQALKPLQTVSIVTAFPLMGVLALIVLAFFKNIEQDSITKRKEEQKDRITKEKVS
ncbi:BCCT family transporter [Caldalkalibacillus mannanilyticus]|uniref:BCCT family transporter n=1 Tax=Caldalkalibacillus mannanilyticus TaxID=1418 RepID=UPI00046A0E35|nr:BCCT family transporter [Caldalkalibacillus mannanilyticus]